MMMTRISHGPHRAVLAAVLLYAAGGVFSVSDAQVTSITSSGLGTTVSQAGTTWNITGGTRPENGSNLFHSFGSLNVGAGNTANFCNAAACGAAVPLVGIQNILGRVTGGQVSNIFGTIQTTNFGTANLFLINPAGWIFGPTASLNVGGSFHIGTADYLKFADEAKFHADLARQSMLTTAPVSAFGFVSQNPAGITIQGSKLRVSNEQAISLVGGNVTIVDQNNNPRPFTGGGIPTLAAPRGTVNLVSVASSGEVPMKVEDLNLSTFQKLGSIELSNAYFDVSGNGGGSVVIRGGQLITTDRSTLRAENLGNLNGRGFGLDIQISGDVVMANGTRLWVNTSGGRGRDIVIIADNVTLSASEISSSTIGSGDGGSIKIDAKGSLSISNISNVFSNTQPGFPSLEATGRGGDTVLNVGTLKLSGTSSINSGTSGAGRAGDVIINARESISLNRGSISSDTGRGFRRGDVTGDGGRIVISSPSLTMDNFSIITSDSFNSIGAGGEIMLNVGRLSLADLSGITSRVIAGVFPGDRGIGNGGTIQIIAKESLTISGVGGGIHATTFGEGKAGSIEIEVGRLTLTDGARIIADTSATGSAGTVKITATESIAISGRDKRTNSTGLISSQSEAGGDGGRVSISAPTLLINEGQISTATSGAGRAGDIVIEAKNATLTGGARVDSSTSGAGRGGDLTVTANSVSISGPGTGLFSTASGSGAGGNIRIQTGQLVRLSNEGTLSAQSTGTATATAGNININTPTFQSQNGSVTTGATSADGGNISITTTGSFVHLTDSQITTSVLSGAGSGGNIAIDSKLIVLNDSQILARAVRGHGGNINITGDVFLVNSGGRAPLSLSGIVDASSELSTPGTVNIEATFTNVTGSVTRLPETPLQATEPMRSSCAARSGGKASRLVIGGRDGLPLQPGDLLPSPLYLASEADIPDTPSTGNEVTRQDLSTRFSLLGPKDRSLNQYSLLPNAKCSL